MNRPALALPVLLASILMGSPDPSVAQTPVTAERGEIRGVVTDAVSGAPLAGASVLVMAEADAALVVREAERAWRRGTVAVTDHDGRYRFAGIPVGRYTMRVRRLGYRPTVVTITLGRTAPFDVSVGLVVAPIRLEPAAVTAPLNPFASSPPSNPQPSEERLLAETLRSTSFLTTDVRTLTRDEVVEAVTLGELDLFRALQRLPGVSTRDDFTAELWTRGAPWSHTRVYFDGMPLFNPVHTSGIFTGVNPDAVGAVFFFPGVRSAAIGEGTAAVLDLTSRSATSPRWTGAAELSAVSARATAGRRFADGRGDVSVALRRSYVDFLMDAWAGVTGDSTVRIPYAFTDGSARVAIPLGTRARLEASGLFGTDVLRGDVRDLIRDTQGSWGNRAGRVTLVTPIGQTVVRNTIATSRFRGSLGLDYAEFRAGEPAPFHTNMTNELDWHRFAIDAEHQAGDVRLSGGAQVTIQTQRYDGPPPRPYPAVELMDTLRLSERHGAGTLWGELRVPIANAFELDVGLRGEVGDRTPGFGGLGLAPRLATRWRSRDGSIALSAGWGRSYQFTQAIAPAGPGIGPDLHLTDVWLLAGDSTPAIRSDVVTAGLEVWLADTWIGAINLYRRSATGMAVPDPTPGLFTNFRPTFVTGTNHASGLELSLRKLVGRWTTSVAYSWARSRIEAEGWGYPSRADRRGVLDATGLLQISPAVRIGGAMTVAQGAPYTRFILQTLPCDSLAGSCPPAAGALQIEAPNAARAPPYVTADALLEWTRQFRGWELGAFLQVRNVLNRRNRVTYAGSLGSCDPAPPGAVIVDSTRLVCDMFDRSVPLIPLAGVTVAF